MIGLHHKRNGKHILMNIQYKVKARPYMTTRNRFIEQFHQHLLPNVIFLLTNSCGFSWRDINNINILHKYHCTFSWRDIYIILLETMTTIFPILAKRPIWAIVVSSNYKYGTFPNTFIHSYATGTRFGMHPRFKVKIIQNFIHFELHGSDFYSIHAITGLLGNTS